MEEYIEDYGQVVSVGNGFCEVSGLSRVGLENLIEFSSGQRGLVIGYDEKVAKVLLFKGDDRLKKGELAKIVSERFLIPVGEELLGRIVDPLMNPLDGKGKIRTTVEQPIESEAKNVMQRADVKDQLITGFLTIDSQIPIGLGQRELLVGQKQVGKSDLAVAVINNQTKIGSDILAVYVAIGIQSGSLRRRLMQLEQAKSLSRTVVVVAKANQSSVLNYIAPMAGMTIAEFFAQKGENVLIVFDNLTRHARFYRQLSLLAGRPSGREAYPGDVFYLHARLLERAGSFSKEVGGGSITALPIAETRGEEITDYITTNLMSITDGHILFSQSLMHKNILPPIDSGFSVSRIGGKTQQKIMRTLSSELKTIITQYSEVEKYAGLGAELQTETLEKIELGRRYYSFVNQKNDQLLDKWQELAILYLITSKEILNWSLEQMSLLRKQFLVFISKPEQKKELEEIFSLENINEAKTRLKKLLEEFKKDPATAKPLAVDKAKQTKAEKETISDVLRSQFKK